MQDELFTVGVPFERGNTEWPILYLLQMRQKSQLIVPEFQRDRVWERSKQREWIESIVNHQAIGVIVTYQIKGDGPIFLADGLQRLLATEEFVRNPSGFGFDFGAEQAKQYCWAFPIPVQHRHYADHSEALKAFQDLNRGTVLTAAEFHKGDLVLSNSVGRNIYDKIPEIVHSLTRPYLGARNLSRQQSSKLRRDCLGLFYQYVTESDNMVLWNVGTKQESGIKSIEAMLREYTSQRAFDEVERDISSFERFLASEMAVIDKYLTDTNQKGKGFSPTALRNLLHTAVWRKNARRPRCLYDELLEAVFSIWKDHKSMTSRFALPGTDPVDTVTLQTDSLSQTKSMCRKLGLKLFETDQRIDRPTAVGYDSSHIKPFSQFGEGPTFIEPSGINRARGAQATA